MSEYSTLPAYGEAKVCQNTVQYLDILVEKIRWVSEVCTLALRHNKDVQSQDLC